MQLFDKTLYRISMDRIDTLAESIQRDTTELHNAVVQSSRFDEETKTDILKKLTNFAI